MAPLLSDVTQTQECTRFITAGGNNVMSLSEDVNITWQWNIIFNDYAIAKINWASRSTTDSWPVYTWSNLTGPSPSSGSYSSQFTVESSGQPVYLGISWGSRAYIDQPNYPGYTYPNWGCY
jgi:hypothetical protein